MNSTNISNLSQSNLSQSNLLSKTSIIETFLNSILTEAGDNKEKNVKQLTTLIASLNDPNGKFFAVKENTKDGDLLIVNTFNNINPKLHNIVDKIIQNEKSGFLDTSFIYCSGYNCFEKSQDDNEEDADMM